MLCGDACGVPCYVFKSTIARSYNRAVNEMCGSCEGREEVGTAGPKALFDMKILLAYSQRRCAGPGTLWVPSRMSLFAAAFARLRWQKAAAKTLFLEGLALQTSQFGVSQQNDMNPTMGQPSEGHAFRESVVKLLTYRHRCWLPMSLPVPIIPAIR